MKVQWGYIIKVTQKPDQTCVTADKRIRDQLVTDLRKAYGPERVSWDQLPIYTAED
jgi:hypothetical protein